jgi:FtsP/CotA-like multicopper oxidase with cupredoxin domain
MIDVRRELSPSRRAFLEAATTLSVGAAALIARGTALEGAERARANAREPARTIHLQTREISWELAPGKTVKAMAYNGQIPGPEIRVREGERVRVVLTNALGEPTTIHWHGVDVPNAMDGVPGITQRPVQSGETFVYEFDARPAGTRWYHTHFQEHRQMDLGLVAPLIVDATDKEPMAYDRELTLVLDDWVTGSGKPLPSTREGVAGGRGSMGGMMGRGMSGMMGGRGMGGMMGGGHTPVYDTMTINGKAFPATTPLELTPGERVRLRIINASADHTHVVRLAGHRLRVTHTDGNPLRAAVVVDAIPIAPSERYDAVVIADHPGAWFLYCTQPGHADAGERMLVAYRGHEGKTPDPPETDISSLDLWQYGLGRGRPVLPPPSGTMRPFDLTLSGGMMGSDLWTINRKVYPNTDPLPLKRGDRARVVFRNMSPEAHPMHLHGQSFNVLAVNGVRYAEPLVKDSVDVEAHMGSIVLEFSAHNPGDWFFHCHKPMHMEGGMISLVKIA